VFGYELETKRDMLDRSVIDKTLIELGCPLYTYDYLQARARIEKEKGRPPSGHSETYSYHSGNQYDTHLTSPIEEGMTLIKSEFGKTSWQKFGSQITELER